MNTHRLYRTLDVGEVYEAGDVELFRTKGFIQYLRPCDEILAQRDELLAALKAIVSFQDEVLNEIDEDRDLLTDADIDREQSAWVLARRAIKTADKQ